MTQTIRLTSKRQATFPARLCRELGIEAGDTLILERKEIGGDIAWLIKPQKQIKSSWFSALHKYAEGKDNDMESIRASIGKSLGNAKK